MENQCVTASLPTEITPPEARISEAGKWFYQHRHEVSGNPIAFLKHHLDLSNLEAIEALKLANALQSVEAL